MRADASFPVNFPPAWRWVRPKGCRASRKPSKPAFFTSDRR